MSKLPALAAVAALMLLATPLARATDEPAAAAQPEVALIDQQQLLARIAAADPQLLILDVRTPEEYASGHIEGALNIAYDQLPERLNELEGAKDREIVVYCRSGRRSEVALQTLQANGFERLAHLAGDMLAWEAAQRPVIATAPPPQDLPSEAPPAPR